MGPPHPCSPIDLRFIHAGVSRQRRPHFVQKRVLRRVKLRVNGAVLELRLDVAGDRRRPGVINMAAFVGFDPFKSHRPQIIQLVSVCVVILAAGLVAFSHGAV